MEMFLLIVGSFEVFGTHCDLTCLLPVRFHFSEKIKFPDDHVFAKYHHAQGGTVVLYKNNGVVCLANEETLVDQQQDMVVVVQDRVIVVVQLQEITGVRNARYRCCSDHCCVQSNTHCCSEARLSTKTFVFLTNKTLILDRGLRTAVKL